MTDVCKNQEHMLSSFIEENKKEGISLCVTKIDLFRFT